MKVIVMRGVSGSGKSSYARSLPGNNLICSADDFRMKNGKYVFDPDESQAVHNQCFVKFMSAVSADSDKYDHIIVDNTNMHLWECAPYYAVAYAFGCELKFVHVICDPRKAWRRNRHGVPWEVVYGQYSSFEKALPWWDEDTVSAEF